MQYNTTLNPLTYHKQLFDKQKLPHLEDAGPVSASLIGAFSDPLEFFSSKPKERTADMAWGSMVDCAWITPELFKAQFVVLPAKAPRKPTKAQRGAKKPSEDTVKAIEWWDRFEKITEGKQIISGD